jgi:hypothetical protein
VPKGWGTLDVRVYPSRRRHDTLRYDRHGFTVVMTYLSVVNGCLHL